MIHLPTLGRSLAAVARNARREPVDQRLLAALLVGYPAWQAAVRAGQAADVVLARAYRRRRLEAPVFVVGHPRSGTTFLHRLLALDRRFVAPKAWELALPSVVLHRLVEQGARGMWAPLVAEELGRGLFSGFAERHVTRWPDPEEDDWLLLQAAASPTLELLTGAPGASARWWIGDDLPARERARVMRWYRRCAQRIVHAAARAAPVGAAETEEQTLLSKNPHFTGWIRTLAAEFPDARFIMVVREPADAISSRLGMVTLAWHRAAARGGPGLRDDPRIRAVFDASCALYRHAEAAFDELPEARRWRVRYDDLVADPLATAAGVYRKFGWTIDDDLGARLQVAAAEAARRVPGVPRKLRQFGLRPQDVDDALGDLAPLWRSLGRRR